MQHTLNINGEGVISLCGVSKVVEVNDKQAEFVTDKGNVIIKGSGLTVVKLDKSQGVVTMDSAKVHSITYKDGKLNFANIFK